MRNSLLRQKLYDRVSEELEAFKAELLDKSPQDIIENAYAIVIREDIVSEIECGGQYSDEQYKALLRLKYPLDTLYNKTFLIYSYFCSLYLFTIYKPQTAS